MCASANRQPSIKPEELESQIYSRTNLEKLSTSWAEIDSRNQEVICKTLCNLADDKDLNVFKFIMGNLIAIAYTASNDHFIRTKSAQFSKNVFQRYLEKHDSYTFKEFLSDHPIDNRNTKLRANSITKRAAAIKSELILSPESQKLIALMMESAPNEACKNKLSSQAMLTLINPIVISNDMEVCAKLPEMAETYAGVHPSLNEWRNDLAGLFTKYARGFKANHRDDANRVADILSDDQDKLAQFNALSTLYHEALKAPQKYTVTGKFVGYLSFALIQLSEQLKLDTARQLAVFMHPEISDDFMRANCKVDIAEAFEPTEINLANVSTTRGSLFNQNDSKFLNQTVSGYTSDCST